MLIIVKLMIDPVNRREPGICLVYSQDSMDILNVIKMNIYINTFNWNSNGELCELFS